MPDVISPVSGSCTYGSNGKDELAYSHVRIWTLKVVPMASLSPEYQQSAINSSNSESPISPSYTRSHCRTSLSLGFCLAKIPSTPFVTSFPRLRKISLVSNCLLPGGGVGKALESAVNRICARGAVYYLGDQPQLGFIEIHTFAPSKSDILVSGSGSLSMEVVYHQNGTARSMSSGKERMMARRRLGEGLIEAVISAGVFVMGPGAGCGVSVDMLGGGLRL